VLTEPLPVPAAAARLHRERLILYAVNGRCRRHRQAEQWQLPVRMDYVGLLLLAKWTRAALAFALRFGFSVEGPLSPSGTFETPTDVRYDFAFGGKAEN
jgi:hypothetical protein